MKQLLGRILLSVLLLWTSSLSVAQTFSVSPQQINIGVQETFTVTYTLSGGELHDFQAPDLSAFQVVGGPNRSQSITMTNGSVARSIGISYILLPKKTGDFSIPPATVTTNNKKNLRSEKIKVKVVQGNTQAQRQSPFGNIPFGFPAPPTPAPTPQRPANNAPPRLFLQVKLDTQQVYVGQQLTVLYQLYTNTQVSTFELDKAPQFTGFWVEELPTTNNQQNITYKGQPFVVVDVKRYALFPQRQGKLSIDALTGIAQVELIDPNANTWFGLPIQQEVSVKSDSAVVQVSPLPDKASAEFTGGVGNFVLKTSTDKTTLAQNESFKLLVELNGTGNVKFIGEPIIVFPATFEHFDPLNTEKTTPIGNRIGGNKTFEYTIVPTEQGKYEIPPIKISYFDPILRQYQQLEQAAIPINVTANNGAIANLDAGNIYPLQAAPSWMVVSKMGFLLQYSTYWLLLVLPILLYIGGILWQRFRPRKDDEAAALVRKNALSVATNKTETAYQAAMQQPSKLFYEQLLANIQQYLEQKSILQHQQILSSWELKQLLNEQQIPDTLIQKMVELIEHSTAMLYAPTVPTAEMIRADFQQTRSVLEALEGCFAQTTQKTTNFSSLAWVVAFICFLPNHLSAANLWTTAEEQYREKNYVQAAQTYEQLLKEGTASAALYHNLGNCYYQLRQTAPAILNYERALHLSPNQSDTEYNLLQANKGVNEKVGEFPLLFYQSFLLAWSALLPINVWAMVALLAVWAWLWSLKRHCRRSFGVGRQHFTLEYAWFFGVVAVGSAFLAYYAYQHNNRAAAIVFAPRLALQQQASGEASTLLELSAGAKVYILDDAADWWEVQAMNGEKGWVEHKYLQKIF